MHARTRVLWKYGSLSVSHGQSWPGPSTHEWTVKTSVRKNDLGRTLFWSSLRPRLWTHEIVKKYTCTPLSNALCKLKFRDDGILNKHPSGGVAGRTFFAVVLHSTLLIYLIYLITISVLWICCLLRKHCIFGIPCLKESFSLENLS